AALAGPWLAALAHQFGNPVFPLMNAWFHSPDAPAVNFVSVRFTPSSVAQALLLPFRMVALDRHLYTETFAPDLRLAALIAAPARWFIAEPWSTRWLPYAAPEHAVREPALYLSIEVLSMSAVAPFLHPASSFANVSGQHSLPSDSPRLAALLERHRGYLRTLGRRPEVAVYDTALRRLSLKVDPGDCFTIAWHPEEDALSRALNRLAGLAPSSEPLSVMSCALVAAPRDPADVAAERSMSALFARIEQRCALLRGQT